MKMQSLIVFSLALSAMIAMSVYYGRRIVAARIPMQWGLSGSPASLAPKSIVLWSFPLLAALMGAGIAFVASSSDAEKAASIWQSLMFVGVLLAVVQLFHSIAVINWAARQN